MQLKNISDKIEFDIKTQMLINKITTAFLNEDIDRKFHKRDADLETLEKTVIKEIEKFREEITGN